MPRSIVSAQQALIRIALAVASRIAPSPTGRYFARRFVTPSPVTRSKAVAALHAEQGVRRIDIDLSGGRIATYCWGDVQSEAYVLLGHGWSSYALRFARWIPHLRAMGYAVLGFDQFAHGLSTGATSDMPDFVKVMREIGRRFGRPAVFVGHSQGAASIAFAEEIAWAPQRFVLIAPLAIPRDGALRLFDALGVSRRAFAPFEDWLHARTGERFDHFHARLRVPDMNRPALIIHDRQDQLTPWNEGQLYAQLWPGARLLSTEGLGHNRLLDDPQVIEEATRFIAMASPIKHADGIG